jgi:hypothetical protein
MKKLFILFIALIPFISSCEKDNNLEPKDQIDPYNQIREIAWNSLDTQQKSTVSIEWKDAKVELTTYQSKSAYSVIFQTTDEAILGPIIIYVDSSSNAVLGMGLRL